MTTASGIAWHRLQWQQLASYQQLPHAFLLSGVAGLGKERFAKQMQRGLLCRKQGSVGSQQLCSGADSCSSCRLIDSNTNPDLMVIDTPPGKQLVIDDIHQLRHFLFTSSHLGGAKAALLLNADRMNLSAANSLLKILEEPPPGKFLILTTANKGLLLPTILSRCIKLQFAAPAAADARAWLSRELGDDHSELLKQDLLFELRSQAPYAIAEDLASGKAELMLDFIRQLENSASWPQLQNYKELETIELVDLLLWYGEQQSKKLLQDRLQFAAGQPAAPSATGQQEQHRDASSHHQQQLLGLRALLINQRAMLLRQLNPNRELLLQEAFFHLRNIRAAHSANYA